MRLRCLLVVDPVETVARQIAAGCERLADSRVIAVNGERAIALATELRPEMVILSLELARPDTFDTATDLRRLLPETFVVITFRELTVPVMERLGKLGIDDFLAQPLDLTLVYRAASRRFGVGFRRHDRRVVAIDLQRADGVHVGRTLDLSEGGLRFTALQPVATDASLLIDLMLPDSPLRVRCRVLELEPSAPGAAVTARGQFENLRGRDQERLAGYLRTLSETTPTT
jgi:CheY-like chemotaxis protein